jgi:Golgi phosphoprotein 3 (GPP34)
MHYDRESTPLPYTAFALMAHPKTGQLIVANPYAFVNGAAFVEAALLGRVHLAGETPSTRWAKPKPLFRYRAGSPEPDTLTRTALETALTNLKGAPTGTGQQWFKAMTTGKRSTPALLWPVAVQQGVILAHHRRFFFLPYRTYTVADSRFAEQVRQAFGDLALCKREPTRRERAIIRLMMRLHTFAHLLSGLPSAHRLAARKRLNTIAQNGLTGAHAEHAFAYETVKNSYNSGDGPEPTMIFAATDAANHTGDSAPVDSVIDSAVDNAVDAATDATVDAAAEAGGDGGVGGADGAR